jgi:methyl-accepting chemotaxis protein
MTSTVRQIADIITVIDEIAFQTNLVVLNAAVVAARDPWADHRSSLVPT